MILPVQYTGHEHAPPLNIPYIPSDAAASIRVRGRRGMHTAGHASEARRSERRFPLRISALVRLASRMSAQRRKNPHTSGSANRPAAREPGPFVRHRRRAARRPQVRPACRELAARRMNPPVSRGDQHGQQHPARQRGVPVDPHEHLAQAASDREGLHPAQLPALPQHAQGRAGYATEIDGRAQGTQGGLQGGVACAPTLAWRCVPGHVFRSSLDLCGSA